MKREETDIYYQILDSVFEAVNARNTGEGTGKSFSYTIKPRIVKVGDEEQTNYDFTITLREMGYGEKDLQTISFLKPKDLDRYTMEVQMIMQFFVAVADTTFVHWHELGKLLNENEDLQKIATEK